MRHKGFRGTVNQCDQSGWYFGNIVLSNDDSVSYEGETKEALKDDFESSVDDYIETLRDREAAIVVKCSVGGVLVSSVPGKKICPHIRCKVNSDEDICGLGTRGDCEHKC